MNIVFGYAGDYQLSEHSNCATHFYYDSDMNIYLLLVRHITM